MSRTSNGHGSVYQRKDGRWEAAAWVLASGGTRKRVRLYAATKAEAERQLRAALVRSDAGQPVAQESLTVGAYLDRWFTDVVVPHRRPRTAELYEVIIRRHLRPGLGARRLSQLTVSDVQRFINDKTASGQGVRSIHLMRQVLSAALTRAMREELLTRNVARLVELPRWQRKEILPWTSDEARRFLLATVDEPLHPAYLFFLLYGLRRGEVLGLRWQDIDAGAGLILIRQQIQRIGSRLEAGPVKTSAGQRDLPLLPAMAERLRQHRRRQRAQLGDVELVFASAVGGPLEPRNLRRSFEAACARYGQRQIALHHLRHTTATLLKHVGVSARDAQLILGHAQVSTTQMLYQHRDVELQTASLGKLEQLLLTATDTRSRQDQPSTPYFRQQFNLRTWQQRSRDRCYFWNLLGGPGGTRTLDTLLKSFTLYYGEATATSVGKQLHTAQRTYELGCVAVKTAVRTSTI